MIEITSKERCSGCYACANACPKECIKMISDDEGFWYPQLDMKKCIDCGLCEKVCPIINKWEPEESRVTKAMAAINKIEEIRLKSSSGGMFTLIAELIIDQGGVVFGAAFSDDFKSVHHISVDNIDDLEKLRGSKYTQSRIGNTYKQAKECLESGRKVLFTGTPCQIGGLYSYLKKQYNNLYTQDIICHGVPSPMVWKKYVEEREKEYSAKTKQIYFRNKKSGWKSFSMKFEFLDEKEYIQIHREDSFMRAFLTNSCLRHSCYACSFKKINRQADITLADFWGIQNVLPEMDDDKGTSLVLVHSKKGCELLEQIEHLMITKPVDIDCVIKYNPSVATSVSPNQLREKYMKRIKTESPDYLASKLFKISLKNRIKSILRRLGIISMLKKLRN